MYMTYRRPEGTFIHVVIICYLYTVPFLAIIYTTVPHVRVVVIAVVQPGFTEGTHWEY